MIAAGFGFTSTAALSSLQNAFDKARAHHIADVLSTPSDKCDMPCFQALSASMGLPVRGVTAPEMAAQPTRTRSERSVSERGAGSVAEAAALIAAGPDARLIAPRVVSDDRRATCALAESAPV